MHHVFRPRVPVPRGMAYALRCFQEGLLSEAMAVLRIRRVALVGRAFTRIFKQFALLMVKQQGLAHILRRCSRRLVPKTRRTTMWGY